MSPKNLRLDCDRALDLLIAGSVEIPGADSDFLQAHLDICLPCSTRSDVIRNVKKEMRSDVVYADPVMVRATQLRVRERAAQMRQQQESMRPLWVSSALALGWAVLSMPLLWQGFAWLGRAGHLPDLLWQTGFGVIVLTPIAAVGTIGLAGRLRNKAIS